MGMVYRGGGGIYHFFGEASMENLNLKLLQIFYIVGDLKFLLILHIVAPKNLKCLWYYGI